MRLIKRREWFIVPLEDACIKGERSYKFKSITVDREQYEAKMDIDGNGNWLYERVKGEKHGNTISYRK